MRALLVTLVLAPLLALGCAPGGGTRGPGPVPDADGGPTTPPPPPPPGVDGGPPPPPRAADSDNDGLPDADETARGTSPSDEDTDDDGVTDGVEVLAGTDPTSAASTIPSTDFYVVLPFEGPEENRELEFRARLGKGDVFFLVDTTGSMGLAIGNVRTSLATTIVPAVRDAIADVRMGVGDFRDFPVSPFGDSGDWPYVLRQSMTDDVGAVQTALNGLAAGGGADGPESMLEGLHGAAAGGSCPDGFGSACFRNDSHPIIVVVTDTSTHNNPSGDANYDGTVSARSWAETVSALNAHDVNIVGAAVNTAPPIPFPIPIPNYARRDLEAMANATASRAVDGTLTVYDAAGGSVSTAVVDGIVDLVGATTQDVTSRKIDDPSDSVDATLFIKAVRPLRATRATRFDDTTFYGVAGGTAVTFQVTFQNDFLPEQAYVQIFQAEIEVIDLPGMTALDTRNVYIVVPAIGGTLI